MPPRNVLLVVLDTVRKDHLTPYGYDEPTTPVLESFADEAVVYEQAVAQAPWTLPVHASLFTGTYPSEHGATQESPYLPEGIGTLPAAVSAMGYETACYSANAWITPYTRLTDGFDRHDNFFEVLPRDALSETLAAGWQRLVDSDRLRGIADRTVQLGNVLHERLAADGRADSKTPAVIDRLLETIGDGDRWFAVANLMDAHLPYHPPERYRETFAPGVDPNAVCQNPKAFNAGVRSIDDDEWDAIGGLYDAEIRHMDAEIGRLFDRMKTIGEWEETVVIVCADHGELHGEDGLYGHEFSVHESLVNVPLLVKHPDVEPGRRTEQIELVDVYDTVLEATGATGAAERVGARPFEPERSLRSGERRLADGEYAFVEYARPLVELRQLETRAWRAGIELDRDSRFYSRFRAVRSPELKYVRGDRVTDTAVRLETDSDPEELARVDGDERAIEPLRYALDRFERRVGGWPDEAGDAAVALEGLDDATRDRLRELGYLE